MSVQQTDSAASPPAQEMAAVADPRASSINRTAGYQVATFQQALAQALPQALPQAANSLVAADATAVTTEQISSIKRLAATASGSTSGEDVAGGGAADGATTVMTARESVKDTPTHTITNSSAARTTFTPKITAVADVARSSAQANVESFALPDEVKTKVTIPSGSSSTSSSSSVSAPTTTAITSTTSSRGAASGTTTGSGGGSADGGGTSAASSSGASVGGGGAGNVVTVATSGGTPAGQIIESKAEFGPQGVENQDTIDASTLAQVSTAVAAIEAPVTPPSGTNWGLIFGIAVALVVLIIGVVALVRFLNSRQTTAAGEKKVENKDAESKDVESKADVEKSST